MAEAFKPTLTNVGRDLLNSIAAGGTLILTRAQLGSGQLPADAEIEPLTALLSPQAAASIKGAEAPERDHAVISLQYDNQGLAVGFEVFELGIFAKGADTAEVLYCYMSFGTQPDAVPAESVGKVIRSYDIPMAVDNRLALSVTIDMNALATTEDIQKILDGTTPPAKALLADDATALNGQPAAYYLNLGNMNAGVLSPARGGTGQTSLQATRNAMGLGNTISYLPLANGGTGRNNGIAAGNVLTGTFPGNVAAYSTNRSGGSIRNIDTYNSAWGAVSTNKISTLRK